MPAALTDRRRATMTRKDRRWVGSPCSNRPCVSTEVNIAHGGNQIIARNLGGTTAASLLATHNADVEALEAENAKLRAVVEAVCYGASPGAAAMGWRQDSIKEQAEYGLTVRSDMLRRIADALLALEPLVVEVDNG